MKKNIITYDYIVIKRFFIMTIFWALCGMLVGLYISSQLVWPNIGEGIPYLCFGRLRPLHTNLVVFGFAASALFTTSYYVVQRTCGVSLFLPRLANFTFWIWQVIIILLLITLPLGLTTAKEYAEMEWPISLLVVIFFISYFLVFFGTIYKRKNSHIYVSNWFYGAFIIAIIMLFVVNKLCIPVGLFKSYSVYSGVVDAMIQWWYGHNAVGFLLTAGFIGMMYYFLPIQAERPVYSYSLSVVHFWGLIGIYMWAGSHHLHYSALPDWVQTIGMIFSIVLLLPSWGGMLNGLMTLSGVWYKLKTDPILRFFVASLSFYGMATLEGSTMAIKTINSLSHNTDWTIGHVHSGSLGWVSMITIGSLYVLFTRIFNKKIYSINFINIHFWCATIGTVFYIVAMWISGIMQGLMWRSIDDNGILTYSFVESSNACHPFYIIRLIGGLIFFLGMIVMVCNLLISFYRKSD